MVVCGQRVLSCYHRFLSDGVSELSTIANGEHIIFNSIKVSAVPQDAHIIQYEQQTAWQYTDTSRFLQYIYTQRCLKFQYKQPTGLDPMRIKVLTWYLERRRLGLIVSRTRNAYFFRVQDLGTGSCERRNVCSASLGPFLSK